jgi:hypothetical protein
MKGEISCHSSTIANGSLKRVANQSLRDARALSRERYRLGVAKRKICPQRISLCKTGFSRQRGPKWRSNCRHGASVASPSISGAGRSDGETTQRGGPGQRFRLQTQWDESTSSAAIAHPTARTYLKHVVSIRCQSYYDLGMRQKMLRRPDLKDQTVRRGEGSSVGRSGDCIKSLWHNGVREVMQ